MAQKNEHKEMLCIAQEMSFMKWMYNLTFGFEMWISYEPHISETKAQDTFSLSIFLETFDLPQQSPWVEEPKAQLKSLPGRSLHIQNRANPMQVNPQQKFYQHTAQRGDVRKITPYDPQKWLLVSVQPSALCNSKMAALPSRW